jgi:hypothetical protein
MSNKSIIIWAIIILCFFFGLFKLRGYYDNNLKVVNVTVVSHPNIVMDRDYHIKYITLVKTDDGYTEEIKGISYYALPIGSRISIKLYRP